MGVLLTLQPQPPPGLHFENAAGDTMVVLKLSQREGRVSVMPSTLTCVPKSSPTYVTTMVVDSVCPREVHCHAVLWQLLAQRRVCRHLVQPLGCFRLLNVPWSSLGLGDACAIAAPSPIGLALRHVAGFAFAEFIRHGVSGGELVDVAVFDGWFRAAVFQVLYTLHVAALLTQSAFRDNDLHVGNVIVECQRAAAAAAPACAAPRYTYCVQTYAGANGLQQTCFKLDSGIKAVIIDLGYGAFVPVDGTAGHFDGRFHGNTDDSQCGMSAKVKCVAYDTMLFLTSAADVVEDVVAKHTAITGTTVPKVLSEFVQWVRGLVNDKTQHPALRYHSSCRVGRLTCKSQPVADLKLSPGGLLLSPFFEVLRAGAPSDAERGSGLVLDPLHVTTPHRGSALPGVEAHISSAPGLGPAALTAAQYEPVLQALLRRTVRHAVVCCAEEGRFGTAAGFVRTTVAVADAHSVLGRCWNTVHKADLPAVHAVPTFQPSAPCAPCEQRTTTQADSAAAGAGTGDVEKPHHPSVAIVELRKRVLFGFSRATPTAAKVSICPTTAMPARKKQRTAAGTTSSLAVFMTSKQAM